jgi:hypothetical protein
MLSQFHLLAESVRCARYLTGRLYRQLYLTNVADDYLNAHTFAALEGRG